MPTLSRPLFRAYSFASTLSRPARSRLTALFVFLLFCLLGTAVFAQVPAAYPGGTSVYYGTPLTDRAYDAPDPIGTWSVSGTDPLS